MYSSFYPLAAASPILAGLDLGSHGLTWRHAPAVVAHLLSPDAERAAVLHRDVLDTAALARDRPHGRRRRLDPHVRALAAHPRPAARRALLAVPAREGRGADVRPARGTRTRSGRCACSRCRCTGCARSCSRAGWRPALITGNALHADVPAMAPVSGVFGWLLVMLGQDVGFPVPQGGAGMLAEALASRARAAGAQIHTGARVDRVVVGNGRALGAVTHDGRAVRARRAVLADVPAPTLLGKLVRPEDLPAGVLEALERFQWDLPTVKLNWALDGPDPVACPRRGAGAGTVHLGSDADGLALSSGALTLGKPAEHDFLLVGQMAVADPTRAPRGRRERLVLQSPAPRGRGRRQRPRPRRAHGGGDRGARSGVPRPRRSRSGRSCPRSSRPTTPRSSAARSTAVPRNCTSSSCSVPCPDWAAPRCRSTGSTCPGRPRTRAAASTAPPGTSPRQAALNGSRFARLPGRALNRATRGLEKLPRSAFP